MVADNSGGRTRYRLLETVRQYALEKLGESGEADAVRTRHRDYYTSLAAAVDAPAGSDYEQRLDQAETEIDNLRAAFAWSRENSDTALALTLASSLQPLWQARGRVREGLTWFDSVLTHEVAQDVEVAAAIRARALADKAVIDLVLGASDSVDRAQQALALARDIDDPAVLARTLTACGLTAAYNAEAGTELTSPRRSNSPGPWTIGGGSARSWPGRPTQQLPPVTRSRRAGSPKKDATSPTRSVTGSTRGTAAYASGVARLMAGRNGRSRRRIRARWPPRPRPLTMRSLRRLASRTRAPYWRGRVTRLPPGPPPTRPRGRSRAWRARRGQRLLGVGKRGPGRRRC